MMLTWMVTDVAPVATLIMAVGIVGAGWMIRAFDRHRRAPGQVG